MTYNNCNIRETIEFTQADSDPDSIISPCEPVAGVASASLVGLLLPQQQAELGVATATFTAPTEPGLYVGTAVGEVSPELPFEFTIEADDTTTTTHRDTTTTTEVDDTTTTAAGEPALPATGSDTTSTMTGIAIGLLAVDLGLFVVAQVRRQPDACLTSRSTDPVRPRQQRRPLGRRCCHCAPHRAGETWPRVASPVVRISERVDNAVRAMAEAPRRARTRR